jgi:hypothetical protein
MHPGPKADPKSSAESRLPMQSSDKMRWTSAEKVQGGFAEWVRR